MVVTWTDIVGVVISGLIWITALIACVIGCIYFNKRLKFYIYKENDTLCLVAFDKGNGSCHISKAFYSMIKQNQEQMTKIDSITNNELKIDLLPIGDYSQIYFRIVDNFGRIYDKTYKRNLDE